MGGRNGGQRPRGTANKGRIAAARALIDVEEGGHVETALPIYLPEHPGDRALAWNIAMGTLRHRAEIDAALRGCLRQPIAELDAPVRAVLRAGAYERLFGRAKAYAVVDQAVQVARAVRAGRASGLVNAVLRRVAPAPNLSRAEALNHPAWLVARWDERYGEEATTRWCEANAEPPPIAFAVPEADPEMIAAWKDAGLSPEPAQIGDEVIPLVYRVGDSLGRVDELPGFDEGRWWVQDPAAAWVTDLVPQRCTRVLDACAAPGGKTFRLAARGHEVLSVDVSLDRLDQMGESLHRLDLTAARRKHDWTKGPLAGVGQFDAVLVDAPCTALGTVRRHPEVRWRRGPMDPATASAKQLAILEATAAHLDAGGVLVYAVCSPEPEEGEELVQRFLRRHDAFTLDTTRTTAPPTHGEDAFWAARMVKS